MFSNLRIPNLASIVLQTTLARHAEPEGQKQYNNNNFIIATQSDEAMNIGARKFPVTKFLRKNNWWNFPDLFHI